jgi:hypothetical protein
MVMNYVLDYLIGTTDDTAERSKVKVKMNPDVEMITVALVKSKRK